MSPDTGVADKPLVLVADDDPTHQLVIQAILKKAGYRILAAPDGKVAVELFAQAQPDVVLMDCQMPRLDGFQATQAIRQLESESNVRPVPIIAVTANAAVGHREKCLSAGMNDYLSKPFTGKQLDAVISKCLEHSEPIPVREDKDAAARESDTPAIDSNVLDGLSRLQQAWDQDLVKRVVQVYLENSRELVTKLQWAIDSADAESVAANAQTLKSSSAKVGALTLADLCETLATAACQGDLAAAPELQQHIQRAYQQVIEALKQKFEAAAA